jgi:hypothetical protein
MYKSIEDRRRNTREWKKKNKKKVSEQQKRWRERNPDYQVRWREENPDKIRKYKLREKRKRNR